MDEASRMGRARDMRFRDAEVYHGMAGDLDSGEFSMARAGETSGSEAAKLGVSASFDVGTASEFADLAARSGKGGNILPLRYRAKKEGVIELDSSVTNLEVAGAIQDAWDAGFDAIRFKNYTTPGGIEMRAQLDGVEEYLKKTGRYDLPTMQRLSELRVRAEQRFGGFLYRLIQHGGGRPKKRLTGETVNPKTLAEMGIKKKT